MSGYYSEEVHGPHEYFDLGDFELSSRITLPKARLAFKTHATGCGFSLQRIRCVG